MAPLPGSAVDEVFPWNVEVGLVELQVAQYVVEEDMFCPMALLFTAAMLAGEDKFAAAVIGARFEVTGAKLEVTDARFEATDASDSILPTIPVAALSIPPTTLVA